LIEFFIAAQRVYMGGLACINIGYRNLYVSIAQGFSMFPNHVVFREFCQGKRRSL